MQIKNKKTNIVYLSLVGLTLLTIFLVLMFQDKNIVDKLSKNNYPVKGFASIFNFFGASSYVILIYFTFMAFWGKYGKSKWENKHWLNWFVPIIVMIVLTFVLLWDLVSHGWNYFIEEKEHSKNKIYLFTMITITVIYLILMFTYLCFFNLKLSKNQEYIDFMFSKTLNIIIFATLLFITVFALKIFFGRPRPNEYWIPGAESPDESKFLWALQPTFVFGPNRGQSFPSGHVASAAMLLGILFLINKDYGKKQFITYWSLKTFFWIIILCVAIARVLSRDHYPTDVTFSIGLTFMYYKLNPLITRKLKIN